MDKPAWHRLGKLVADQNTTLADFQVQARMNYLASLQVATYTNPLTGETEIVPDQYHIVRSDDGRVVSPSTVGSRYTVVTTDFMRSLLEPLVEAGYARPDAMFTLRDGQVEVMVLRLVPLQDRTISGDPSVHSTYMCIQNFHGGGSLGGTVIDWRAVCANTVPRHFNWKVRHTATVEDRAAEAVRTWEQVKAETEKMDAALSIFATTAVPIPNTIDELLGIKPGDKLTAQAERKRDEWIAAARKSPGTAGKTLLDIWNGATYLATHDRSGKGGQDDSVRFDSLLNGTRYRRLDSTFKSLASMAGIA